MKKKMIFFTTAFQRNAQIFCVHFEDQTTLFLPKNANEKEERAFFVALSNAISAEIIHYAGDSSFFPLFENALNRLDLSRSSYCSHDLYVEAKKLLPYRVSRSRLVEKMGIELPIAPREIQKLYKQGATCEDIKPYFAAHMFFLDSLCAMLSDIKKRFVVSDRKKKIAYLPDGYKNGAYTGKFYDPVADLRYVTPAFLLEVNDQLFRFVPHAKHALLDGEEMVYHDARYMKGIALYRTSSLLSPEDFLLEDVDRRSEIDELFQIIFETILKEI